MPNEVVLLLQENFQITIWEEEDFGILEQAIENDDRDTSNAAFV